MVRWYATASRYSRVSQSLVKVPPDSRQIHGPPNTWTSQDRSPVPPNAQRLPGWFNCLAAAMSSSALRMELMPPRSRSSDRATNMGAVARRPSVASGIVEIWLPNRQDCHAYVGRLARLGYDLIASPLRNGVRSSQALCRNSARLLIVNGA